MDLKWATVAEKSLSKLDETAQRWIVDEVAAYVATARGNVKKLKGTMKHCYRLRIGDWRVIFTRVGRTITVLDVLDRRDAYR